MTVSFNIYVKGTISVKGKKLREIVRLQYASKQLEAFQQLKSKLKDLNSLPKNTCTKWPICKLLQVDIFKQAIGVFAESCLNINT